MADKKAKEVTTEVTDAPDFVPVEKEPEPYVSPQTRAEMELGRKTQQANALNLAAVQARQAEEAAQAKTDDEEKEQATREAKRVGVFPHAANQQIKP